MRLSAKALNFLDSNHFTSGTQWTIRAGEPNVLYFQVVDLDQALLRYIPGIGSGNQPASIVLTFPSVDDAKIISVSAVKDDNDSSIWKISLSATQIPNSGNVQFAVTEGSTTRRFSVLNMLSVEFPLTDGSC